MKTSTPTNPADFAERLLHLVVLSMLGVAVIFAISIFSYFGPPAAEPVLDIVQAVLANLIIAAMIYLFVIKLRPMTTEQRRAYLSEDGFIYATFRKALARSWMFVLVLLSCLQALDNLVLSHLPPMPVDVLLQCVLVLLLVSFGVAFYISQAGLGAGAES